MKDLKTQWRIRFRKNKHKVIEWAEAQGNFNDAVTYLIEKEIAENGIRNLENFIPAKRTSEYWANILNNSNKNVSATLTDLTDDYKIDKQEPDPEDKNDYGPSAVHSVKIEKPNNIDEVDDDDDDLDDIPACYKD